MQHKPAERSDNGIVVRLLWDSLSDRVIVRYRDLRSGDAFAADVPRSQALTAFRHSERLPPGLPERGRLT